MKGILISCIIFYILVSSKSNVLEKSPMGWNSWDCYGASVDEETVRKNADFMAKNLLKYGWE